MSSTSIGIQSWPLLSIRPRPVPLVLVTGPHATTPPCPLEARQTQSYRVPTPPTIRTRPTAPVPTPCGQMRGNYSMHDDLCVRFLYGHSNVF